MIFVRTFKGYEDKTSELDRSVNTWVQNHKPSIVDVKAVLSHEPNSRANSGDLLFTVLYEADEPVRED